MGCSCGSSTRFWSLAAHYFINVSVAAHLILLPSLIFLYCQKSINPFLQISQTYNLTIIQPSIIIILSYSCPDSTKIVLKPHGRHYGLKELGTSRTHSAVIRCQHIPVVRKNHKKSTNSTIRHYMLPRSRPLLLIKLRGGGCLNFEWPYFCYA